MYIFGQHAFATFCTNYHAMLSVDALRLYTNAIRKSLAIAKLYLHKMASLFNYVNHIDDSN